MESKLIKSRSRTLDAWLVNLSKTGRSRKQAFAVSVDTVLVIAALWGAYTLRHGLPFSDFRSTWHLFVFLPAVTVVLFMSLGIYRWVIRSSNSALFRQIVKGAIASALFLVVFGFLFPPDRVTPRSLFVIYALLLLVGTSGVRFLWQALFDSAKRGEPVAIYGAGSAGQQLVQSLGRGSEFQPVLFLDDNQALHGTTLLGVPVMSPAHENLSTELAGLEAEKIIFAIPSMGAAAYQQKVNELKPLGLPTLTIPTIAELLTGTAKLGQIRNISISDILGRSEVPPDVSKMEQCVRDKVVLVTGGGGSIGSELCRQIITLSPKQLIVLDHSEANLYQITEELSGIVASQSMAEGIFVPRLCSVADTESLDEVFDSFSIQSVFHAAAYKHVPIIQEQPEQGVKVNVFGTLNVLQASLDRSIENFLLISTDKAVRPTNSMGATKRIAELVLQAKSQSNSKTKICMVRFGNVLGSSGSVVPKFKKQIEAGGPITLTHENITRYFMTIPEAAQLVLQASSIAKGGDVFVLDMGDPIKIKDLAVSMVKLAGKSLYEETGNEQDIKIQIEGLRPGEKMYEELFLSNSQFQSEVPKVFTAGEQWIPWDVLQAKLDTLKSLAQQKRTQELRDSLLKLAFLRDMPKGAISGEGERLDDVVRMEDEIGDSTGKVTGTAANMPLIEPSRTSVVEDDEATTV